jgi:hypothetical protein
MAPEFYSVAPLLVHFSGQNQLHFRKSIATRDGFVFCLIISNGYHVVYKMKRPMSGDGNYLHRYA